MRVKPPTPSTEGYDPATELDEVRELGFTLTDQSYWFVAGRKPSVPVVVASLLQALILPLCAVTLVRLTGRLYLDAYRPRRGTTDEVVTPPTADEVVQFERETAKSLRLMHWVLGGHFFVGLAVLLWPFGITGAGWLLVAWACVSSIQLFRFLCAADRLAADIRGLHRDYHDEDRARFPYGQRRSTFPKV